MRKYVELERPVAVVCPSRNRPEALERMIQSVFDTSNQASVLVYIDADQESIYRPLLERPHVHAIYGTQIGPVHAANKLIDVHRGHCHIYGMVPDDSQFSTPGWDDYLIDRFGKFPKEIGVIAAAHNGGDYVNFPWVSRNWIETVGWYYYPKNFHHCCDSILEMLGEATEIEYASPQEFAMNHDLQHTFNRDKYAPDLEGFLNFCVGERREIVRRLREARKDGHGRPSET